MLVVITVAVSQLDSTDKRLRAGHGAQQSSQHYCVRFPIVAYTATYQNRGMSAWGSSSKIKFLKNFHENQPINKKEARHLKIFSRGKNINIFASQTIWPNYDLKWIKIRSEKILQHLCWLTLTKSLTWLASTAYYKLQVSWHHCRHLSAWLRGDVRGGVTGEAELTITRGIFLENWGRK